MFNISLATPHSLAKVTGILAIGLSLSACGDADRIAGDDGWMLERSTQSYACNMVFRTNKQFSHNCNGRGITDGTWSVEGSTIRVTLLGGQTLSCGYSFDGGVLVLAQTNCPIAGRYETTSAWYARTDPASNG